MNKSTISESFGEQLAIVTAGTRYEIDSETDKFISELEHRIRRIMYSLWMDAQSEKLADYLEKKKIEHFKQLYEFSYGVTLYDQDQTRPKDAESLALRIIHEKSRYIKQIEGLRERYKRFKRICDQIVVDDKQLIISYFEMSHKVDYEMLRSIIREHLEEMESIYKENELQAELDADKEEEEYQATLGKKKYRINNKYIYMSPSEHHEYLENEKKKNQELYKRLGIII